MNAKDTRSHIVEKADRLFYEKGFEHTSFADIANVVGISRGNFYYHFKTKDEILDAVIAARLHSTQAMLDAWEGEGATPEERISCFIRILIANQAKIELYGCPVGTLVTELAKLEHAALGQASELFTLFRAWLARQFTLLGRDADADALAMHLLARSQGVATLYAAYRDHAFVESEVEQMRDWVRARAEEAKTAAPSSATH